MSCQRALANGFRVGVNLDVIEALGSDRFNSCDVTYLHVKVTALNRISTFESRIINPSTK
jgi:hypothetical protein